MQEAKDTYHDVICGKDFSWLYRACTEADQIYCDKGPLMMVKILATAIQQNCKPLEFSCVRTLKAETSSESSKILLHAVPNSPSFLSDDLLVVTSCVEVLSLLNNISSKHFDWERHASWS